MTDRERELAVLSYKPYLSPDCQSVKKRRNKMRKPRINKHRYGFCIEFGQHVFFNIDINEWRFIPSIEFYRRPGVLNFIIFAFLCFQLQINRWRFDKR